MAWPQDNRDVCERGEETVAAPVPFCRKGEDPGIPDPAERGHFSVLERRHSAMQKGTHLDRYKHKLLDPDRDAGQLHPSRQLEGVGSGRCWLESIPALVVMKGRGTPEDQGCQEDHGDTLHLESSDAPSLKFAPMMIQHLCAKSKSSFYRLIICAFFFCILESRNYRGIVLSSK